ncbi:MAG: hypothetical protein H8M99_00175 [Gloeobacteraceae cyanobacterium ES-bin-144]|nr:hypothetical protein [Verrucomicrobiales bacterium]
MKTFLLVFASSLLVISCGGPKNNQTESEAPVGYNSNKPGTYADKDFSAWMTKAEQQIAYEKKPAGTYFACTEGRNFGGLNQYRHIQKPLPQEKYSEWAVFWGMNSDEFYTTELKLMRAGFVRDQLQVFIDSDGRAMHQVVWLKPLAVTVKPKK